MINFLRMKKGAVPVPYIIAIILGIIVLVLLVYWLFFGAGPFTKELSLAQCKSRLLSYCTAKAAKAETPEQTDWEAFEPGCKYLNWAVDTTICNNAIKGIYPEG